MGGGDGQYVFDLGRGFRPLRHLRLRPAEFARQWHQQGLLRPWFHFRPGCELRRRSGHVVFADGRGREEPAHRFHFRSGRTGDLQDQRRPGSLPGVLATRPAHRKFSSPVGHFCFD